MIENLVSDVETDFPLVVVGTYEEFLLGYRFKKNEKKFQFVSIFAEHAHKASVRCVSTDHKLLASSGADEYINLYDMLTMVPIGTINQYNGTITCLEFTPDKSHLLAGSQEGSIAIYKSGSWKLVKLWKDAHKHANGVISITIHPSSKLALSLGADNILRTWNLIKGRQAYAVNLKKKCSPGNMINIVKWSKTGQHYVVCIGSTIEVYSVETAGVNDEIVVSSKISHIDFSEDNYLVIGTDGGVIEVYDMVKKKTLYTQQCHEHRIKCFELFCVKNAKDKIKQFLVSGDSGGFVKLWLFKKNKLIEKAELNLDCRITCMTMVEPVKYTMEKEEVVSQEENVLDEDTTQLENHNRSKKRKNIKNVSSNSSVNIEDTSKSSKKMKTKKKNGKDGLDLKKSKHSLNTSEKSLSRDSWIVETI